jgi:aspartate-semialdehyde dehydrogenase
MSGRIEAGVLGATGMVGQHFVRFLENNPWFDLTWVGASDRSAGKKYKDATSWRLDGAMPSRTAELTVSECKPGNAPQLMFSAMDAAVAGEIEQAFAAAGHIVVSNSKNHRMENDVPLLVPEINAEHLALMPLQAKRGWKGSIATNPNCSTVGLTMGLAPLKQFGIQQVMVTTMQAVSGAGYPGVPSVDILGNVVPYIGGEEEKMEIETRKILGDFRNGAVEYLAAPVSAQCNRVPVLDGHLMTVSVKLSAKVSEADVKQAIRTWKGKPQDHKLPSAPAQPLQYLEENDRPQPRRDATRDRGMAAFCGRLRPCSVLDWKFIVLVHNTVRGAAGAAVLNAELMRAEGMLQGDAGS